MDIQTRLDNIATDEERSHFLKARSMLRKSYLTVLHATVGIDCWSPEDDTFLDAIDLKIEMLMARGAQPSDTNANEAAHHRPDPFAHITRPSSLLALEQSVQEQVKQIADERQQKQQRTDMQNTDMQTNNPGGWQK